MAQKLVGIKIGSSSIKLSETEVRLYNEYIKEACNYIAETLGLKLLSIGGGDFNFSNALAFRLIKDNGETFLDRSIEIRIDQNNTLYLDTILGSIELTKLKAANELEEIASKLKKFNFTKHSNRIYTAKLDGLGNTLPDRADYKNSDKIFSIMSDLPERIFDKKDLVYKLAKILTNDITLEFHSEIHAEPKDENPTNVEQDPSSTVVVDTLKKEEQEIISATAGTPEQEVNPADSAPKEKEQKAGENDSKIKITIGEKTKEDGPSIHIGSQDQNTEDDYYYDEATAVSLQNNKISWGDWAYSYVKYSGNWAYENMYPIAGTIACIGGGIICYKWINYIPPAPTTITFQEHLNTGDAIVPQMNTGGSSSTQAPTTGGSLAPYRSPGWSGNDMLIDTNLHNQESFFDTMLSPARNLATRALKTAQKGCEKLRLSISSRDQMIEDAAEEILTRYTTLDSAKYGSNIAHWLQGDQKDIFFRENFINLLENLPLKSNVKTSHDLAVSWRDGLRSDNTLDLDDRKSEKTGKVLRKGYESIFNDHKMKTETIIKKLNIPLDSDNNCRELGGMNYLAIYNMLREAGHNGHLLYLIIMGMIIENNIVAAEDNIDLFQNNNATEWHSLSMVTEADFGDIDKQLVLKLSPQTIKESYKDYQPQDSVYTYDANSKCTLTLDVLITALNIANNMGKSAYPIVSLINNFYTFPELHSRTGEICRSIEKPLDDAYYTAEEYYETVLELLGIESAE